MSLDQIILGLELTLEVLDFLLELLSLLLELEFVDLVDLHAAVRLAVV